MFSSATGSILSRDIVAVRERMDIEMTPVVAEFIAPHLEIAGDEILRKLTDQQYTVKLVEGLSDKEFEKIQGKINSERKIDRELWK